MRSRIHRLRRDERGIMAVLIGLSFLAFMAATTIAIDVGLMMAARAQAQSAADAGALAGAVALGFDSYTDRSPSSPAVQSAINAATANKVMRQTVSVTAADVSFPPSPTGVNNRVKVDVYRTAQRGNALPTFLGKIFGLDFMNVRAAAIAEAAPADAMTCVKPFIIPDKWLEKQTAPWDMDDTFDLYDNKKQLLANPDIYIGSGAGYTGYNQASNKGQLLIIRAGGGSNIYPTFYFSLAMGNITGGDEYRWNIENCNTLIMHKGDIVLQEPGNMEGPTIQGAEGLIARDPAAYWDAARNKVHTTMNPSPRVFPIPLYDPIYYETNKQNGRFADFKVANWIGFFLEQIVGNQLYGRIIPISGIATGAGPAPDGAMPIAIRLVG